ncbi:MAG: FeoA domain-containing protein, partial [Ignisphaera sp.]|nr:FeoA domain-containing protein [Ignisphaera sp.]
NMNPGDFGIIYEVILGVHAGRLMEMGFIRGTRIWVIKNAPLGDLMELSIRGNHVALRRDEAQSILVDKENPLT